MSTTPFIKPVAKPPRPNLPRGSAFGVGILDGEDEDDIDIYRQDAGIPTRRGEHPIVLNKLAKQDVPNADYRPTFHLGRRHGVVSIQADLPDPPKLPENYNPFHALPPRPAATEIAAPTKQSGPPTQRTILSFNADEEDARILKPTSSSTKLVRTPVDRKVAEAALRGFLPFSADPAKQARYRQFLLFNTAQSSREEYDALFPSVRFKLV
jgi:hypothetical protein